MTKTYMHSSGAYQHRLLSYSMIRALDIQNDSGTGARAWTGPTFECLNSIISFSYDSNRTQKFDDSARRYFVDPPVGAQLSYGYDDWVPPPTEDGKLDDLLRAISRARSAGNLDLSQINAIALRGVMTRIMVPNPHDGCEINVMIVNDIMYLEEHISDERMQQQDNMPEHQRKPSYYGQAFYSYATTQTPPTGERTGVEGGPPSWGGAVRNHVSWCHVVEKELGGVRLLMGGEIHCTRGLGKGTESFVQLKTSLPIRKSRRGDSDKEKYNRKLIKCYFQSLLLGTPVRLSLDFRSPSGEVTSVESLKTADIPQTVERNLEDHVKWWAQLYADLRQRMNGGKPETVWRVRLDTKNSHMDIVKLDGAGENSEGRVGFLPRWYWDELRLDV
ncbi:hypothetical protein BDZ89DRAFT_1072697 [Hymenopellis radicata]|nr:hypothetical protein BDZ89DRAFT_1072697 [Hymenopellis radicata]